MIESHTHGAVTELRIARHDRRNALNTAHCRDLHAALDDAVAGGTRVVVLTGDGTAFCSGADLDTVGFGTYPWGLDPRLPIIAIVWYIGISIYRRSQGIALANTFKEIPPE